MHTVFTLLSCKRQQEEQAEPLVKYPSVLMGFNEQTKEPENEKQSHLTNG